MGDVWDFVDLFSRAVLMPASIVEHTLSAGICRFLCLPFHVACTVSCFRFSGWRLGALLHGLWVFHLCFCPVADKANEVQ